MQQERWDLVSNDPEREELESILAAGVVDRHSNLGRLLSYICDKYFRGQSAELREYNIALDVFGRSSDFDKRRDSIVRVEASRLRRKLREFYEGPGRDHPLRIDLPAGQYIPRFLPGGTPVKDVPEAEASPEEAVVSPHRNYWLRLGVPAALVLLLTAGAFILTRKQVASTSDVKQEVASAPLSFGAAIPTDGIRILAGYTKDHYVDRAGRMWLGDRYFRNGAAIQNNTGFIFRTLDPTPFQTRRTLGDFFYDIPANPGLYELRLHFAETEFGPGMLAGGAEGSRVIRVAVNGQTLYKDLDVLSDAGGPNTATVKIVKNVQPQKDGFVHLAFTTMNGAPFVNAIELLPAADGGRMRPIRIVARETSYTDRAGKVWDPDAYFLGGRLVTRKTVATNTADPDLYLSERYGSFSYAVPVAPGRYRLNLRFAETWFCGQPECGGGSGQRVFNVYLNGVLLVEKLDIFKEAGGPFRALDRTFHNLEPNPQGKLLLTFEPVKNYACVNAIEVVDESEPAAR